MVDFFVIGAVLGLAAGFAPGPLLALVIAETLQHDIRSGVKVALAPVITDLPIIIVTLFLLAKLAGFHDVLGVISLVGGCVLLVMAYQGIRTSGFELDGQERKPKSLTKGVLVNVLSPHPYLFWLSVGAPMMIRAMGQSSGAPVAFIASFYAFLVGSKILLAVLASKSKSFLRGKLYLYVMRSLGLLMAALALVLFRDGLQLLGIFILPSP